MLAPYYPRLVASYYTQGLFRYGASGLRFLFGSIPFAIGELIYIIFIFIIILIILIINTLKHINSLKSFNYIAQKGWFILTKLSWLIVRLYVVFQLIWGLNYMQPDPTEDFHLTVQTPENTQIAMTQINALTYELIDELNKTKTAISLNQPIEPNFEQVVANVQQAYKELGIEYPRFILQHQSIKKAIFPTLGDYIGFLAFYQPITAEAIVRSDLPILTQPYTVAHEMAHQLGYASETEANFIAFVVASEANDP